MRTCVVVFVLGCCLVAGASEDPKIMVAATGSTKIVPAGLQVWVTLKEKAADAAAATVALRAAQEKLAAKFKELGVKSEPFKSELPTVIDKAAQNMQRQMRTGQRLKRKPAAEDKPEIEMQQMVRTLISFTAKDVAGVLVEAETLKAKIKAAKLVEEKTGDTGDGDEDDNGFNSNGNVNSGPVSFMYFAPKNEDAHKRALADALKKANDSALSAAQAMGKTNVELYSLTVGADTSTQTANQYYQYSRYGYQMPEIPGQDDGDTSQSPQMTVNVQVSAEFHFK